MRQIYLDYNATAPLRLEAREAMEPYLAGNFGNPASLHWAGQAAHKGLDQARAKVAGIFNVKPEEIVFTSGGTEAANLAIRGVLAAPGGATGEQAHVITSPVEHHAILEPLRSLEKAGLIRVSWLSVDREGRVNPDQVRQLLCPETALIVVMFANNEIGNIYPVGAIGRIAREAGIPFFCDGVQVAGKLPVDLRKLPIDLFSFSAHKFGGPKGVGGLFVRKGIKLAPFLQGGGQEGRIRGGTENLSGIIGLAAALESSYRDLDSEGRQERKLCDLLCQRVLDIPGSRIYGDPDHRLPNTLNVGFEGIESETILVALDREGIAASNGAACASGTMEPSHVLIAMGYSVREARGAIRFSVGWGTTQEEIEGVGELLPRIVKRFQP